MVVVHRGRGKGRRTVVSSGLVERIIEGALSWDVLDGVARRAWARNSNAIEVAAAWNRVNGERGQITLSYEPEAGLVEELVAQRVKPAGTGLSP